MTGLISLWYGVLAHLPPGWHLCDGTANTPDLRNRFIVGAGDTYDPDDNGSLNTHRHGFTSDGHIHTLLSPGPLVETAVAVHEDLNPFTESGITNSTDRRPPYKAIYFIMKV